MNQQVTQLLLAKLGHDVDVVEDGLAAVQAVRETRYDLVLMDMQMPNLDGLQATSRIRAWLPPSEQPYIVAITANAMIEDRAACTAAGMDGYVSKPLRSSDLQAVITAVRRHAPERRPDDRVARAPRGPAVRASDARRPPSRPDGREADLRRRLAELGEPGCREDDELLAGLLRSFRDRAPTALHALRGGARARTTRRWSSSSPTRLKGAALNVGADGLGAICQQVEASGRGSHLAGVDQALGRRGGRARPAGPGARVPGGRARALRVRPARARP